MANSETYGEYSTFASATFDVNDYANAVLAGEPYPPPPQSSSKTKSAKGTSAKSEIGKEDISMAVSKLDYGIDDVAKQLRAVIVTHHEALLNQVSNVHEMEGSLQSISQGLSEVNASVEKLRMKIHVPYQSLSSNVARLKRLQLASDLLRRTSRFVIVARRLEFQMSELDKTNGTTSGTPKDQPASGNTMSTSAGDETPIFGAEGDREKVLSKAALSIAELVSLFSPTPEPNDPLAADSISLKSVHALARHMSAVEAARVKVTEEMESMVLSGLTDLNPSVLASSLQTAFNLRVLPELVQSLLKGLTDAVEARIRLAFDVARLSKELGVKKPASPTPGLVYKSRVRTEPTNITAPQWTSALWTRLEGLIEEMAGCCVKVYTLEKVLKLKKDAATQTPFLDEAMKLLEGKPSSMFWTTLARSLDKQSREAAKGSTFFQQTLSSGYPRLLRLFHDFFGKIAVQTDTTYNASYQSPETVIVLRAFASFESLYLSRSSNRMNEIVAQAVAGGARSPPGASEGINIARTIVNELDSARFDPLLVRSVAKHAVTALEMLVTRIDALVIRDRSATSFTGPTAAPQQTLNAQLVTTLYQCWHRLGQLDREYDKSVISILQPAINNIQRAYERVCDPLLSAIRREVGSILPKLHRVDLGKPFEPTGELSGTSAYMKELVEKLSFIRTQILGQYNVGELGKEWVNTIVKYTIKSFILHASIAKPLGESGKLQLTTDMTDLEFAINAFMMDSSAQSKRTSMLEFVGDDYRVLRALRPLLFLENSRLASPEYTVGLQPLIILHHILVRSPISLPHTLHGWSEAEYVRWINEHQESEAWTLVERCLTLWENEQTPENRKEGEEYVELARTVLKTARKR